MIIKRSTESLPTIICSNSIDFVLLPFQAFRRRQVQISIVKMVEAELKIEVKEDIKAAIITANMQPLRPEWNLIFVRYLTFN